MLNIFKILLDFLHFAKTKYLKSRKREWDSAKNNVLAVDMIVHKSFLGLCTPHVQVVHQPWSAQCTSLGNACTDGVSKKSPSLARNAKSVSKSVLHNSYVITVSMNCPSCALSKLGPNLTHAQILTSCVAV